MIQKIQRLYRAFDLKKFLKFGFIGILNTLIDFVVFYILNRLIGSGPIVIWMGAAIAAGPYISNFISYVAANIHSFLWNKFWTFQKKSPITRREAVRFVITSAGYVVLSTVCLAGFMAVLKMPFLAGVFPAGWIPMLAKVPAVCVTIFYNYLMNRFWVFC